MRTIPRQEVLALATHIESAASNWFKVDDCVRLTFLLRVTAVLGTSPTLTVTIVTTDETTTGASTSEFQLQRFPVINHTGNYQIDVDGVFARHIKFNYVLAGTDPSFTFSVHFIRHI